MSHAKFSKYAADGSLYTDANRPEFTFDYVYEGYHLVRAAKNNWADPIRPYNEGINAAKRAARAAGYKSLKQFQRDLKRETVTGIV